ncbi:MAG TPA: hypothetical protein VN519_01145 [Bryobacteraceae bacterium]|nr:hypothetical protein [Bryobacteraceae bacterium]
MNVAEHFAKFMAAAGARTLLVSSGELTHVQAMEENNEAIALLRVELSREDFDEFMRLFASEIYRCNTELSALGRPIPGNDTQKPN